MAVGMVGSYQAYWDTQQHNGQVKLHVWYGQGWSLVEVALAVESAEEMQLLVDLLRNEKPIWFDSGKLRTGLEPVGEGEE